MAIAGAGTAFRHLRALFGAGSVVGLGDGPLLARYSGSKDQAAFEALVTRHGPMVLATCRAVLDGEHDVEDAFQATFLVLAKKAGTIRGDALGGWLHRVAYRASVQAGVRNRLRRRKEAEASAMVSPDVARPRPDDDLRPVLHEEIDRLPEGLRLPVVLCDLEGLTYRQAADQLRWTEPTLRCRLARARQRLKARLARRGFTALVVGAILAPEGAPAASAIVPPALLKATVLAAAGGPASVGAAILAHTLLKGMLMTQIKIASAAAIAAVALVAAGVIAAGPGRPEVPGPALTPGPPDPPPAVVAVQEAPAPAPKKPAETVEIKGRVVAPDGRPVAGALVRGAYVDVEGKPFPSATSGPDGRFAIRLPKPGDPGGVPQGYLAQFPWIVASAPGFGPGWAERALRADRPAEQVVTLVEAGTPIEGRVVDLEGRAVADAKVRLNRAWFDAKGDLSGWIARARNGAAGNLWEGLESLLLDKILAIEAKTGPDGRFKLDGVGRDRIADLIVSGPGVATTQVNALCRDEPEIRGSDKRMMRPTPFIVQAPRFQLALAPSRRVEGVARDQESGRPIAGLELQAAVFDEHSLIPSEGVEAVTDAEGRYRIDGLALAAAYRLFVNPGPGLPYFKGTLKATAGGPAPGPVACDFALKRGVILRGVATDQMTGKPVLGYASYYALADNPNVDSYAGFRESYDLTVPINRDGTFELVALPGRGLIGVRDEEGRHKGAVADDKIPGYNAGMKAYNNTLPDGCYLGNYHIIAAVDLDPKAEPARLELRADPGKSSTVEVVDPDGHPLGGVVVKGMSELFQSSSHPEESTGFEVQALDPARPRRIVVIHEARKLIGSALLKGDEAGPVVVRMAPWGSVLGRIVDDEGRPRKGLFIASATGNQRLRPETDDIIPGGDMNSGIAVGNDGLFCVARLVPGLRYGAKAGAGFEAHGDLFVDLTVGPGEARNLGDIKVQPPKKAEE